jgi:hypothetical protein
MLFLKKLQPNDSGGFRGWCNTASDTVEVHSPRLACRRNGASVFCTTELRCPIMPPQATDPYPGFVNRALPTRSIRPPTSFIRSRSGRTEALSVAVYTRKALNGHSAEARGGISYQAWNGVYF